MPKIRQTESVAVVEIEDDYNFDEFEESKKEQPLLFSGRQESIRMEKKQEQEVEVVEPWPVE